MTDKLPTIHIPIKQGSLVSSGCCAGSRGTFQYYTGTTDSCDPYGPPTVAYDPAVPRCKTCCHWNPPFIRSEKNYPSRCDFFQRWMKHEDDGSGYCSNHPEAKP